jgi:hypothetical protein
LFTAGKKRDAKSTNVYAGELHHAQVVHRPIIEESAPGE